MKRLIYILLLPGVVVLTTCKKLYLPNASQSGANYLVVEGLINSGADSTIIKLSRATAIATVSGNSALANPELKATVVVEDDKNKVYPLKETSLGYYVAPALGVNAALTYRLRITTNGGEVYLSDYEAVKASPPIDSIGFKTDNDKLTIYANAHDATNNTRYYRWEYSEAWKFQVAFDSKYSAVPLPTLPDSLITPDRPTLRLKSLYTCFGSDSSSTIVLGSTVKLAQDVLYQAPITVIPSSSEKISIRYSILVKQYALSKTAYAFWANLKTNTENLGSIFDAQPSNSPGNIHCISNVSLPVIGYVSVGTVQTKRIFIDKTALRTFITAPANLCGLQYILFKDLKIGTPLNTTLVPVDLIYSSNAIGFISGYTAAYRACADCTTRGVLKQPPFWK